MQYKYVTPKQEDKNLQRQLRMDAASLKKGIYLQASWNKQKGSTNTSTGYFITAESHCVIVPVKPSI